MSDQVITRCPGCRTAFRVTPEQLASREGQVRCGHCRAVFDANDHLVAGEVRKPQADASPASSEAGAELEPSFAGEGQGHAEAPATAREAPASPTEAPVTPAEAPATTAEAPATTAEAPATPAETPATPAETPATPAETPAEAPDAAASPASPDADADAAALTRAGAFDWRPRRRLREQPKALHALAIVALVALLFAQLLFEYRDALAARAPATRPLLEAACRVAGCRIEPLRDASALYIEASDLEVDPAHKGLLKLSATVRNRAVYPIAFPYLELTLTDASEHVVARRAFPPATYARADDVAGGIAANGEVVVRLFLDASATSQAGYRVYLFYP